MSHACGPDCTSAMHEPIIEMRLQAGESVVPAAFANKYRDRLEALNNGPVGYTSYGEPLWPWSTED